MVKHRGNECPSNDHGQQEKSECAGTTGISPGVNGVLKEPPPCDPHPDSEGDEGPPTANPNGQHRGDNGKQDKRREGDPDDPALVGHQTHRVVPHGVQGTSDIHTCERIPLARFWEDQE